MQGLNLEEVASGLVQPVDVVVRPDDDRLYVVQQGGSVVAIAADGSVGETLLDVTGAMVSHGIEQGLLGMAFHPDFPDDPRVFAFHSLESNDNVLVSYELGADGDRVDPDTRTELLVVDKEPDKIRHNGGKVLFGPDGLLYLSTGDAARASVNGQDPSTLPGSILRLDVDGGDPYAIPPDNPFAGGATLGGVSGAPEVWWFGLRNPWRFSIDPETGLAWIGDVGQDSVEEVDVVAFDEPGLNFGGRHGRERRSSTTTPPSPTRSTRCWRSPTTTPGRAARSLVASCIGGRPSPNSTAPTSTRTGATAGSAASGGTAGTWSTNGTGPTSWTRAWSRPSSTTPTARSWSWIGSPAP